MCNVCVCVCTQRGVQCVYEHTHRVCGDQQTFILSSRIILIGPQECVEVNK